MIRINIADFHKALSMLPIGKTRTKLSATDCILFNQLDAVTTQIQAQEPGNCYVTINYRHGSNYGGNPGTIVLTQSSHFMEILDCIKKSKATDCVLNPTLKGLKVSVISTDGNKFREMGTRLAKIYSGSYTDYKSTFPDVASSKFLATVSADSLKQLIIGNNCYSRYLSEGLPKIGQKGSLVTVEFASTSPNSIGLISNSRSLSFTWSRVETPVSAPSEFSVEGRLLQYLYNLTDQVSIYHSAGRGRDWLTFKDSTDQVVEILTHPQVGRVNSYILTQQVGVEDAVRVCKTRDWAIASLIMCSDREKNILILEHNNQLELRNADDVTSADNIGNCPYQLSSSTGTWTPCVIPTSVINILNEIKAGDYISITQHVRKIAKGDIIYIVSKCSIGGVSHTVLIKTRNVHETINAND